MHIVRLKRGYSIRLSDSEFEVLWQLANEGAGAFPDELPDHWSRSEKAAFNRVFARLDAFRVNDDRRR